MRADDELLFRNGAIFDGGRFLPAGTTVRVRQGKISQVGPPGPAGGAASVDLDGGTLLPGFTDAHVHPVFAGDQLRRCDLQAASTAPEYAALVAAYAGDHPDEEWITGGGWAMDAFPRGIPTRELLDAVVPDRPVFLPNRDGHGAWVNSKALALAGSRVSATLSSARDGWSGIEEDRCAGDGTAGQLPSLRQRRWRW